jgi:Fur family ferric uptake transcriptional regulator
MVEFSRDEAKQRIHEAGLRATAPRVAVLRLLASAEKPLSHTEVVGAIGSEDWDQATLYRNLLRLVEVDLARVASKVGGVTRYEARGDDDSPHLHPHFSCRTCGSVECLPEAKLTGPVDRRWNRSLETSELQLIGDCPDCLAAQKPSQARKSGKRVKPRQ